MNPPMDLAYLGRIGTGYSLSHTRPIDSTTDDIQVSKNTHPQRLIWNGSSTSNDIKST